MKSLIIGGMGFVGTYLAGHLLELGHEVAVTKMPGEPEQPAVREIQVYELNILEKEAVLQLLKAVKADYIFHLAAQSSVALSWRNPGLTIDVNVKGSVNVLEALRESDKQARMLLVGSGEEYGSVLPQEIPVRESCGVRPCNIYAATKVCQNMIGNIYANAYDMNVVMVRAFNHIGPRQSPLFVISDFCRQTAQIESGKKEAIIKTGNLDVRRDFTDVRDVVRAYALLVQKGEKGETYNVGSGHAVSIKHIVEIILQHASVNIEVKTDPLKMRPTDVPVIEADIGRIQKIIGWKPEIELKQTIQETLDYWRDYIKSELIYDKY